MCASATQGGHNEQRFSVAKTENKCSCKITYTFHNYELRQNKSGSINNKSWNESLSSNLNTL